VAILYPNFTILIAQVQVSDGPLEGSQGKVIEVRRRENRVLIEGLNIARKKVGGTVYNIEQGIQASKVALLDPEKKYVDNYH
jgi:ribosomal protein L24